MTHTATACRALKARSDCCGCQPQFTSWEVEGASLRMKLSPLDAAWSGFGGTSCFMQDLATPGDGESFSKIRCNPDCYRSLRRLHHSARLLQHGGFTSIEPPRFIAQAPGKMANALISCAEGLRAQLRATFTCLHIGARIAPGIERPVWVAPVAI
jgi:hypothetical protein